MAATLTQDRFSGDEWLFERKLDGIRLLAYKRDGRARLFSRNRLRQDVPAVADAVERLPVEDAILDGELTWGGGRVHYHVFDVMWLGGCNVMTLPLVERRALLAALPLIAPLERVASLDEARPWERACAERWEGVIAKRRDSRYESRRSKNWLKMKCEAAQAFVVGGFTDPQGGRVGLGALLVGYFDGPALVYAGKVGTGFDTKLLLELRARLDASETGSPPFTKAVGLPRVRAHWVRPEIVIQAAFIEWTAHGKLRHSRLLGLRPDKAPHDVIREPA
jgi:bifunctional non-homologous end joining protein LigD